MTFEKDDMMKLPIWFNDYLDQSEIDKKSSTIVTRSWANVYRINPTDTGQIENYQGRLAMAIHLWKAGYRQATEMRSNYSDTLSPKNSFRVNRPIPESIIDPNRWILP